MRATRPNRGGRDAVRCPLGARTALGAATFFFLLAGAAAAGVPWWDTGYGYRKQLTVTAGATAVPDGYSVSVTFDHAALVAGAKSLATGDDVRVVHWNGAQSVEIDRALDPDSGWDLTNTTVWFMTQAAIGASGSDSHYYLYYGNASATGAPADETNVFHFADFFDRADSTTVGQGWVVDAGLTGTVEIAADALHILGDDLYNRPVADHTFAAVTEKLLWQIGFDWQRTPATENTYRLHMQMGDSTGAMNPPPAEGGDPGWPYAGVGPSLVWAGTDQGMTNHEGFGYETGATATELQVVSGQAKIEAIVDANAGTYEVHIDGALAGPGIAFSTLTAPASIDQLRFMTWNLNQQNFSGNQFTYTLVRKYVSPEPAATLGAEETPAPATITVAPEDVTRPLGASVQFTATYSGIGTVSWSVSGGGTMSPPTGLTSTFQSDGTTTGDFTVTATDGTVSGAATVHIASDPPVATTVTVTPDTADVPEGGSVQLSAEVLDQYGDPMTDTISWSVKSGGGSASPATGTATTFTAGGGAGISVVAATCGTAEGTGTVNVLARDLTTINVAPAEAEIAPGEKQTFTAQALDQFGDPFTATISWDVSGGGVISPATGGTSTFTSDGTVGEFTVEASSGAVLGTAAVTVAERLTGVASGDGCLSGGGWLPTDKAPFLVSALAALAALARRRR